MCSEYNSLKKKQKTSACFPSLSFDTCAMHDDVFVSYHWFYTNFWFMFLGDLKAIHGSETPGETFLAWNVMSLQRHVLLSVNTTPLSLSPGLELGLLLPRVPRQQVETEGKMFSWDGHNLTTTFLHPRGMRRFRLFLLLESGSSGWTLPRPPTAMFVCSVLFHL